MELKIIQTIKERRNGYLNELCFLKDGRLASCEINDIMIYKLNTYELVIVIENSHDDGVNSIFSLQNGNLASCGSDTNINIWEIKENNYKLIHTLKGHNDYINKIVELKDNKLCSCSIDKTIRIWDSNYNCIKTLKGHKEGVKAVLEMNNHIISVGDEDAIIVWNKSTYQCETVIKDIPCCYDSISKLKNNKIIIGGKYELFISDDLSFQSRNYKDKKFGWIYCICILKTGEILLGNDQGMIIFFDVLLSQIMKTFKVHNSYVTCLIKSEDNKLFSASYDSTINIFKIP